MQLLQHMFDRFDKLADVFQAPSPNPNPDPNPKPNPNLNPNVADVFQVQKARARVTNLTSYHPNPNVYQVQKVRKTANESYLAAAGLPDPDLLPSETDRACGIAGTLPLPLIAGIAG